MPKLVQKCGYIRNGSAAKYMRYIATREGVEKLHGRGPVTQPQKELIERLLKDYPDTKELFEYSDYCASPTFGNASELITMALDANIDHHGAGCQCPYHGSWRWLPQVHSYPSPCRKAR